MLDIRLRGFDTQAPRGRNKMASRQQADREFKAAYTEKKCVILYIRIAIAK